VGARVETHDQGDRRSGTARRRSIRVPGPVAVDGLTVRGPGWTLTLAPGWTVRAGERIGDMMVVREKDDAG